MTRYGFAFDLKACMGCHTCTIACKQANNLPDGVLWNNVKTDGGESLDTSRGTYPTDLTMVNYAVNCQHCDNPACVAVCPTGASYVDEETGIVRITTDECIGCGSCIQACPYDVRRLLETDPVWTVGFPVGDWDAPEHRVGTVGKCMGCYNRIARDEKPACMDLCPGRARWWGDLDDPNSDVSKIIATREYERLLESAGTEPRVFYLK